MLVGGYSPNRFAPKTNHILNISSVTRWCVFNRLSCGSQPTFNMLIQPSNGDGFGEREAHTPIDRALFYFTHWKRAYDMCVNTYWRIMDSGGQVGAYAFGVLALRADKRINLNWAGLIQTTSMRFSGLSASKQRILVSYTYVECIEIGWKFPTADILSYWCVYPISLKYTTTLYPWHLLFQYSNECTWIGVRAQFNH